LPIFGSEIYTDSVTSFLLQHAVLVKRNTDRLRHRPTSGAGSSCREPRNLKLFDIADRS